MADGRRIKVWISDYESWFVTFDAASEPTQIERVQTIWPAPGSSNNTMPERMRRAVETARKTIEEAGK